MTCYDLRFPEQARALVDAGADVLVVPSAWVAGERKVDHWRTLVRARAIENTAYVVAVGQPGPRYTGHSMVVDPLGDVLVEAGEEPEIAARDARSARCSSRPAGPTPRWPTGAGSLRPRGQEHSPPTRRTGASDGPPSRTPG